MSSKKKNGVSASRQRRLAKWDEALDDYYLSSEYVTHVRSYGSLLLDEALSVFGDDVATLVWFSRTYYGSPAVIAQLLDNGGLSNVENMLRNRTQGHKKRRDNEMGPLSMVAARLRTGDFGVYHLVGPSAMQYNRRMDFTNSWFDHLESRGLSPWDISVGALDVRDSGEPQLSAVVGWGRRIHSAHGVNVSQWVSDVADRSSLLADAELSARRGTLVLG